VSLVYRTQDIQLCDLVHNDKSYNDCIIALAVDESEGDRQEYCGMIRATNDYYVRQQQECYDAGEIFHGQLGGYY
ncbi:MAG: hypothetical protein P8J32_07920, partial [bacterium]|nr:hypothetical protein [bacterium]